MTTSNEVLRIEKRNLSFGAIEIWTIDRPSKLNAINSQVIKRIETEGRRLLAELSRSVTSCRALILTGAGDKAFIAGADISEMDDFDRSKAMNFSKAGHAAFGRLEELPVPTIAAVNGFALGGGLELALCCDVILASSKAVFGQPEAQLGLIPGFGATLRFVQRVGMHRGLEYLWSCKKISSEEALKMGLVSRLAPSGKSVLDFALEVAEELTVTSAPLAISAIKKTVKSASGDYFAKALEAEAKAFGEMFDTKDKEEGVSAFLEKRSAQFKGV